MRLRLASTLAISLALACATSSRSAQPRILVGPVPPAVCIALTPADTVWPAESLDFRPVAVSVVPPIYPGDLRSRGVEGKAAFSFRLQPTGRADPCSIELTAEDTPGFAGAARVSILSTYYQVPMRGGKPAFAALKQSIAFRLH